MQLLLILSAMLSALTGALGVRAPEARSHQIAVVRDQAVVARLAVHGERPQAVVPGLAVVAMAVPTRLFALGDAVPIYADRRRE